MEKQLKGIFVTAIHTDSGKTLASAVLASHLKAHYWKPVQCGLPADTDQIKAWMGVEVQTHPERFRLQTPASPHFAAQKEGVQIRLSDFQMPDFEGAPLVVEGAGGLMVPLSQELFLADLAKHLNLPLVLVVNHYLGALNHTLLTLTEIKQRNLPLAGIIFNGEDFQDAESVILKQAGCPCILRIPKLEILNREVIKSLSEKITWEN